MGDSGTHRFIFYDPQGKRWPRLRRLIFFLAVVSFVGFISFVQSLFVRAQLQLPSSIRQLQARLKVLEKQESASVAKPVNPLWLEYAKGARGAQKQQTNPAPSDGCASGNAGAGIVLGAYQSWNPSSLESLKLNARHITHLSAEWLSLINARGTLAVRSDAKLIAFCQSRGILFMPILDNLVEDSWQPEAVEGLVNGPIARQEHFISQLVGRLKSAMAGGVIIDWQQVDPAYEKAVTAFFERVSRALHGEGLQLWINVPMGPDLEIYNLESLAVHVDRFVASLSDETGDCDAPGPLASQEWFEGWVDSLREYVSPSQWIVGIGSYGYDWAQGEKKAERIGFHDVMSRAGRAGLAGLEMDPVVGNPHFSYEDEGTEHNVWFLDVATFINQIRSAEKK